MSIIRPDGDAEPALALSAASRRYASLTGHRPCRATLWRWHLTGRLKCRRIGKHLFTTESALRELIATDELDNASTAAARAAAAAAAVATLASRIDGGAA